MGGFLEVLRTFVGTCAERMQTDDFVIRRALSFIVSFRK